MCNDVITIVITSKQLWFMRCYNGVLYRLCNWLGHLRERWWSWGDERERGNLHKVVLFQGRAGVKAWMGNQSGIFRFKETIYRWHTEQEVMNDINYLERQSGVEFWMHTFLKHNGPSLEET